MIELYREHEVFLDLAAQTKSDYQKVFNYLKNIDDVPLIKFDRPLVVRIRDRASTSKGRRFGNYVKAVLSILFGWGSERGHIRENVASGIKDIRRKKGAPRANRPWSDAERAAVLEVAPAHMRPAFALMMFTGLGPKDALTLPRTFYRQGEIATRRSRTNQPVFWPAPKPLADILASAPDHSAITLCATSSGTPWTLSGFRASWRPVRIKLEASGRVQPGLTLYGLRHTVAVILREIGFDERTIADALGQRTIEMARHYSEGADLRRKMAPVVAAFDRELNERSTKVVKPVG
ncbi:tyrosine-type recombinase/integrase [Methylobacterium brachiatum]